MTQVSGLFPRLARDLRRLRSGTGPYAAEVLVNAYNFATAPHILRTDREEQRVRRYAPAIRKRLARIGALVSENEDGRLRFDRMAGTLERA